MKWHNTTDSADIKKIVKKYYDQLYILKFDNEMDQFLEKHHNSS